VCRSQYDVFSAVIETRRWGFGFRVHNWRDRWPAPNEWGLRVQFWRWHVCIGIRRQAEMRQTGAEGSGR
jgi:hypothetical protein